MKFFIKTYGCQMNERDSEHVAQSFINRGYQAAQCEEEADVILLNTCSVRDAAEQKAIGKMGFMSRLQKKHPSLILGYFGCMAQSRGAELLKLSPHIHLVVGTQKAHRLADYVHSLHTGTAAAPIVDVDSEVNSHCEIREHLDTLTPSAFISIMQGCNMRCSYCIVPATRGAERSRPISEIVEEATKLAARGTREITLLGQIVNRYGLSRGTDTPSPFSHTPFVTLLHALSRIPGIERIRFTSPHPIGFGADLVAAFSEIPQLAPHIHLPLQSGSDRILRAMRRGYTLAKFHTLVEKLRATRPDMAFTTDIIVGFPGETDEDFQSTLRAIQEIAFDNAYIFKYSPRTDTPAPALDSQVPEIVKEERNQILLAAINKIMQTKLDALVGTTQEVLAEGPSRTTNDRLAGRTLTNKIVVFDYPRTPDNTPSPLIGKIFPIRIVRASTTTLYGEIAGSPR